MAKVRAKKTNSTAQEKAIKLANAAIKRRETKFWASDKATRRVMIAKDVLAQLDIGKIEAARGVYLMAKVDKSLLVKRFHRDDFPTYDAPAREALTNAPSCTACAIGSVFVSTALVANRCNLRKFSYTQSNGDISFNDKVSSNKHFSVAQLRLMEEAFEVRYVSPSFRVRYPSLNQCASSRAGAMGEKYESAKDRLRAIMENVIANNGTFVP